ncbi:MAG: hypothetical protein GYB20_12885 [Oceanospirillales bacterium]|nr:hypothetical protein [Oceanospirillales bacterium]MBR9888571.1 hypothetical protein [Oceanospirillales bacterium]
MGTESVEVIGAITKLIPVLGGAIIGVIGGLVGTTYAHKLSKNTDKTKEKKSKLEQLVTEVFEVDIWIKKEENYYLYGGEEILEQSPISKIEAIQTLYFSELSDQVTDLSNHAMDYRKWLIDGAQLRLAAKSPSPPKDHMDKITTFYNPLKASINNVIKKSKEISGDLNAS